MQYKILFVDDETANLRLLERLFRSSYSVLTASSGDEAVDLLETHDVALIISDQRMPGMTGIEFLKRASELRPQTVRIMLTGYTDAESLVEAINSGVVYKYVTKPWINEDLHSTVKRALQHYETMKAQRQLQLHNERLQTKIRAMRDSFVGVIGEMLDLKDPQARNHAQRTRDYSLQIGKTLKLDPAELDQLSLEAFLHEAADFRIPSHILFKEGSPTPLEQRIIEQSFQLGLQMLESVPEFENLVEVLKHNHENYDGSGFPYGFSRDQIPLHAQIIAVANAYDVMTLPRLPQTRMSHDQALDRLRSLAGTRFSPEVVEAFIGPNLAIPRTPSILEPAYA